jgi:hypothetical protein
MCTALDWEAEGLHLGKGNTGASNVDAIASVTLQRDALVLQRSNSVAYEGTAACCCREEESDFQP